VLENNARQVRVNSLSMIRQHHEILLQTSRQVSILSPENILKRGFSITYYQGKALMDASKIQEGEEITTIVAEGEINSIVKNIKNKEDE
jgi:exodeoxyribonuclease VII large subunit